MKILAIKLDDPSTQATHSTHGMAERIVNGICRGQSLQKNPDMINCTNQSYCKTVLQATCKCVRNGLKERRLQPMGYADTQHIWLPLWALCSCSESSLFQSLADGKSQTPYIVYNDP